MPITNTYTYYYNNTYFCSCSSGSLFLKAMLSIKQAKSSYTQKHIQNCIERNLPITLPKQTTRDILFYLTLEPQEVSEEKKDLA